MKAFCVILLSAFLSAVVSNPVENSNDTEIASNPVENSDTEIASKPVENFNDTEMASNPVENSNDTAIAEKANGLMQEAIGDLDEVLEEMMDTLESTTQYPPTNFTNSEITTNDVNGTMSTADLIRYLMTLTNSTMFTTNQNFQLQPRRNKH